MKKRVVSMLAICAMMLSVAVAGAQAEPVKLTMWTLFTGGEGSIMTDLISKFNAEHPDIVIEEQLIEWAQYYNKLLAGLISGESPDIGIMHLAVLPDYASRDALNPIGDLLEAGFADKFLPNIIAQAQYDGKLYAIPIDTHPMVLYYNKKVLKDAGIPEDKYIPKTWDDLLANSRVVKEKTGKWGLTLETGAMLGERWWIALYHQLGATFMDPASGKLVLDTEKAAKAYDMIATYYKDGLAINSGDYNECEALFINGDNAYHFNGVWAMSVYPTTEGLDFGVASLPAMDGSKPFTWGDSHSLVFPKKGDDAKLKAALTFGQWFSAHTMEWAKAGHLPVNGDVLKSEEFLGLPMRKDFIGVGENAVLAPSVKGWTQLRTEMWEIGQRVVAGELEPQAAADELNAKIEEISAQ